MIKIKSLSLSILVVSLLLVSCAGSSAPADAVSAYWQSMVAKDAAQLSSLSCADHEAEALITLESFGMFEPILSDLACSVVDESGETATVHCAGTIEVSYGAEILTIDLAERDYAVRKEDGDWRMCGAQ